MTEKDKMIKLLESKIETIIRNVLREKEEDNDMNSRQERYTQNRDQRHQDAKQRHSDKAISKRGEDNVENSQSFKRQYKAIEKELGADGVSATGVFRKAGIIPKATGTKEADTARGWAFKKLHKNKTPDGTGTYKFDQDEVADIFNALP